MATTSKSQKTSKPSFSIIIPNLNGQLYLATCLYSLLSSLKNAHIKNFEIILVDNASTDESVNLFSRLTQTYTSSVILNKKNHGFAQAINQGVNKAKHKYIVVCNNDIKLHKDWFTNIKKNILLKPYYSTYFGLVLSQDGTKIESLGLRYYWKGKAKNIGNKLSTRIGNKSNPIISKKPKTIWGASASLVVYKKDIFQKLSGFDNDFFAYEEDVDLALRLKHLDYKTLFIPQSISYHIGGATSSKMGNFRNMMDAKNWIYIIIKNYSLGQFIKYLPKIIEERLRNLSGLIKQTIKIYGFKSIWILPVSLIKTYGQVLLNTPKMLQKRRPQSKFNQYLVTVTFIFFLLLSVYYLFKLTDLNIITIHIRRSYYPNRYIGAIFENKLTASIQRTFQFISSSLKFY